MNTTINGTISCGSFSSLSDILTESSGNKFNITDLVDSCPTLCNLAWGEGNPDLSGIGVFISYILQFILTVIFGPLFPIFYSIAGSRIRARLQRLHGSVFNASALFSISVAVATIVYLKQTAVLFEVTFLYYLNTMQFLSILCLTLSSFSFIDDDLAEFDKKQALVRVISCVLESGLYLGCLYWIRKMSLGFDKFPQLVSACEPFANIIPGFPKGAPKYNPAIPNKKAIILWSTLGLPVKIILGILELAAAAFALWLLGKYLAAMGNPFVHGLTSLAFLIGTAYCLGQLENKRRVLAALIGSDFKDNVWGFGQVLAVFAWIPLLVEGLYGGFKTLCLRDKEEQTSYYTSLRKASPSDSRNQEVTNDRPRRNRRPYQKLSTSSDIELLGDTASVGSQSEGQEESIPRESLGGSIGEPTRRAFTWG